MRVLAAALLTVLATAPAFAAPPPPLDMETIMADPDWIGAPVEDAYWSVDGTQLYYSLKHDGSPVRDLYRVAATGGTPVQLPEPPPSDVRWVHNVIIVTNSHTQP